MEGNPKQTRPGVSGVFNLVPAGVPLKQRKYVSARFPQGAPGISNKTRKEDLLLGVDQQNAPASRQREGGPATAAPLPTLLLTNKSQQATPATKLLQGVPRVDSTTSNYFVLMKSGRDFSVFPLDATYTFKTYIRPSTLTIEEVEATQRAPAAAAAAAAAADAALLLPKSLRRQLREEEDAHAADRQLKEDVLPLLKDKAEELAIKYSSNTNKLVVHASDNEEESDDDMDFGGDDGDGDAAHKRGRKGKSDATQAAKGRKGKGAKGQQPDADIPEDELAEDIYAGEEDDLRPVNPRGEDADWEFHEEAADDDLAQGASDEEGLDDDPGYRKELGLEGDEEEDEEEKKQKEEELEKEAQKAAAAAPTQPAAADAKAAAATAAEDENVESMDMEDEELLMADEEDFDVDDLDRLAAQTEGNDSSQALKKRKQGAGRHQSLPPGTARGNTPPVRCGRASTPAGGRRGTTPPSSAMGTAAAAAAIGRGATPPPGAAAGRLTPPPGNGAKVAAAAAGRRGSPPLQGSSAKRKRDATAAGSEGGAVGSVTMAGTAAATPPAAGGQAAWNWTPEQLDAQGVPTTDGVIHALRGMGPIPTENFSLLQERLAVGAMSAEGRALLKKRLLQVAKVEKDAEGRKYMVLK